jgi:DNA-binding CsgD family transcriptional regulator
VLVGREAERQTIRGLLAGARVGDSRVLVLSGEPGIGKSALLGEAEGDVQGMRVLRAQGVESEQFVPFAGLLQLLRPLLPLLEHIPDPQSSALSAALLLGGPGEGRPSRFAVGAATLSLLARAAEDDPLAVLVDDAHLLDAPSAEALVFAARRLVSDAVAMLLTVRAGEPGAEAWASLPTLAVGGLDLESAGELVHDAFGAVRTDRLARLHRATAGNPLGLLELGGSADDVETVPAESAMAVSERISRSFMGRASDLDDDARLALLVAAADSQSVATVHRACAALGVGATSLAEAEDAGLVAVRGDRVEFRHPLVRSAVYGAADPETRRAVHRALADAVPREETSRLAWHLSGSAVAPDEATAVTLDAVADQASGRGAHAIAASAHERAAALTATPKKLAPRLAAAAEAAWLAGHTDRAVDLLDRALAAEPDPYLRAHIHELRGAVETRGGSLDTAHALLVAAALEIEDLDPDRAVRMYADAVHVCFYRARADEAQRAADAIERLLQTASDPDARYLGTVASGMALVLTGEGARGIEKVRAASYQLVVGGEEPDDEFRLPLRLQGALWVRSSGPHRAAVTAAIDRMRDQAALGSLPYMLMHIARDAATTDRWDDAETAYVEGIRLSRETGQSTDLAASLSGLAVLNARRGKEAECRENIAAAEPLIRAHGIRLGEFWLEFAQGDLLAGRGDLAGAARHYESLREGLATTGLSDPDQSCTPELVETYVHLSRLEEATVAAREFAASAAAKGQPWSLARAERALALCDPGGDQRDGAERHFTRALELHAETPDLYETARTQLAFGAWLRRDRHRVRARPLLRAALSTFEGLGARPWADKAAAELEATGETVHRREAEAIDELTPQERQIAQLLAEGRTTRQAAAALFISPKTVEYHLRHVYLKLGIRSRSALAETFGGR